MMLGCKETREDRMTRLIDDLYSPSAEKRFRAVSQINSIDPNSVRAVPALIHVLADPDTRVRAAAARSLGDIAPTDPVVISALTQALGDADRAVRSGAVQGLIESGPLAEQAVPALIRILHSGDLESGTAKALGAIGPAAHEAVPALIDLLYHRDVWVRAPAAGALGNIGAHPAVALPPLRRAMEDPAAIVRAKTAKSVWQLSGDTDTTVPVLIECLSSMRRSYVSGSSSDDGYYRMKPDESARYAAVKALGEIGPRAIVAKEPLLELRRDPTTSSHIRRNVDEALARICEPAPED